MAGHSKEEQARAMIAALQSILDSLPENGAGEIGAGEEEPNPPKDPTHELFVDGLDQYSLAGLFTSIRIIHKLHSTEKNPDQPDRQQMK